MDNTEKLFGEEPETIFIDASTLEGHYSRCPRSYEYYALKKREVERGHAGRAFGRVIHRVLATHYSGEHPDVEAEHKKESDIPADDYRNAPYAFDLHRLYRDTYYSEPFTVIKLGDEPVIELAFAQPIGTIDDQDGRPFTVVWTGIIDLAVRWPDGRVWTVDHKTSKVAGETFWAAFSNSSAQIGYCWAWWKITGTMPAGYIINALFTREKTRNGKGMEITRQLYPLDESRLVEWEKNTMMVMAEMLDNASRDYWPMHTGSCKTPYGMCEYLPVCRLPHAQREAMLNSNMYKNVTWDPLET